METEAANSNQHSADQQAETTSGRKPQLGKFRPRRTKKQKLRNRDVAHLKYFEQLVPLLERLHDVGCKRDTAGNRELHYDQYCLLNLLFLFNPPVFAGVRLGFRF